MGKTSNLSKEQWNKANYVQIKVSVKPEIATAFKNFCQNENVSIAGELSKFMADQSKCFTTKKPAKNLLSTRSGRHKLITGILRQLEQIRDAEVQCLSNIPDNLQGSVNYEKAEQSLAEIEEAIDSLGRAYE